VPFQRQRAGAPYSCLWRRPHLTWTEAFRRGRSRWLIWTAMCTVLGSCFLVKGGTLSDFLWASLIGAVNGIAVGFAIGPAAEKGAMILSGPFAGTPFYFIGISGFVIEAGGHSPTTPRHSVRWRHDCFNLLTSWRDILVTPSAQGAWSKAAQRLILSTLPINPHITQNPISGEEKVHRCDNDYIN